MAELSSACRALVGLTAMRAYSFWYRWFISGGGSTSPDKICRHPLTCVMVGPTHMYQAPELSIKARFATISKAFCNWAESTALRTGRLYPLHLSECHQCVQIATHICFVGQRHLMSQHCAQASIGRSQASNCIFRCTILIRFWWRVQVL